MHQQHLHQMGQIKGLSDVVIHSGSQASFPVRCHGIGCHRDDGELAQAQRLANDVRGGVTVHDGHL